jgi:hypothetical protein
MLNVDYVRAACPSSMVYQFNMALGRQESLID